jgi:hypothetical protein
MSMPNTHQVTGGATQATRSPPGQRKTRRRASTSQQSKTAAAKATNLDSFTTFEVAAYEGGYKTISVIGKITMETGLKLLALANQESKA